MFELISEYSPMGDQITAIDKLVKGFEKGNKYQTLLGVTGSGKTFTMANIIKKLNKPTLIIAHNKTLAAQLYNEMKEFFPNNSVEYFVSYYDYYQPEAYVPSSDTYIEKDSSINEEIDRLRHSATAAISEKKDCIIIASVSCIYGLGDPIDYKNMTVSIRKGDIISMEEIILKLVNLQYVRNDYEKKRGTFRIKGDVLEIYPVLDDEHCIRIDFFGDEIEKISMIDKLTSNTKYDLKHAVIFPSSHYAVEEEKMKIAITRIENELEERYNEFLADNQILYAQRIKERTKFDIEMLRETGICSGIENYSRHLSGKQEGEAPYTLLDYFPKDFLIIIDESHITIPQIRGMYAGDRARKQNLVDYGFRLKSALDNRPLEFSEFEKHINQILFVSATPSIYEKEHEQLIAEQIIRPTGLLDPKILVKPTKGQIDDLYSEINIEISKGNKILVTTLTKKMAQDLTEYLAKLNIRIKYLHSDIDTLERSKIIRDMRLNKFDCLVGINLLREGLDIPEVSLVAILDADKEGFLRSKTSLIQTIGRAARNKDGRVIMYADKITDSMNDAINETKRRRKIQEKYNKENNIIPQTIKKKVHELISISIKDNIIENNELLSQKEKEKLIKELTKKMKYAAANLEFEIAAKYRDEIEKLKE